MSARLFPPNVQCRDKEAERRFEMSPDGYLEQHSVVFYLRDITRLLLENRDERPVETLHHYFSSILDGSNVLLREFDYVNANKRNRSSFVNVFRAAYASMPSSVSGGVGTTAAAAAGVRPVDTLLRRADCMDLVRMLCPDFKDSIVQDAFATASHVHGSLSETTMKAFAPALALHLHYSGFLRAAHRTFSHCDKNNMERVSRNVFVLCLKQMILQKEADVAAKVVSGTKNEAGAGLTQESTYPNVEFLDTVLGEQSSHGVDRPQGGFLVGDSDSISFNDFCAALMTHASFEAAVDLAPAPLAPSLSTGSSRG